MERWVELFQGEGKELSMTRLLAFLSFFPASIVLLINRSDTALGWYLSAYVAQLVGSKGMDSWREKVKANVASRKR